MARESIAGVVVEAEAVAWSLLQPGRADWVAGTAGVVPLAPAATAPERAEEADARLADVLKPLAGRLRRRVALGIASDQVMMRVLRLPSGDPAELAGMVDLQAEKLAPFSLEAMVIGHEVLLPGPESSLVLVAAVRTDLVERLGAVLRTAGLVPARVDVVVLGWWRTLQMSGHLPETGCRMHVRMAGGGAQLLLARGGVPLVLRSLPTSPGGLMPPADLARELNFTRMAMELEVGVLDEVDITLWVDDPAAVADWRRSVEAALGGNVELLAAGDLPPASEGVARRAQEPGRLDLTPSSWTQARVTARLRRRLFVAASAVVGVWALVVAALMGCLAFERHKLVLVQAEREAVRRPALEVRETRRRVNTVQLYLNQQQSALECLRQLSELLPPGVDLTSFTYRKGEDCRIAGESATVPSVYDLKTRLDATPFFAEAVLQGPRQLQNGRQAFDLILKLAGEPL